MFVGGVIPIGWRVIVVCTTIIGGTIIIRPRIVLVRTVRPRTVNIRSCTVGITRPVVIAVIDGDRADDGAGGEPTDDTGGGRSAVTIATTIVSSAMTIATTIISHIGDQTPQ
jgi:hypothetical protein